MPMNTPDASALSVFVPRVSYLLPPLPSQGDLQDQQVGQVQAPMKLLLFLGPSAFEILSASFKNEVSISPALGS